MVQPHSAAGDRTGPTLLPGRGLSKTMRDAARLFWTVSDQWTKRRLLLALALVASGALITAFTPVALKRLVDLLTQASEAGGAGGGNLSSVLYGAAGLVLLYVAGQFLSRTLTELRQYVHGGAEQRLRRHIAGNLFEHLIRLPLQFHLDRRTGAMGETAEQGVRGYQLLLTHAVYTVLPILVELVAVALILVHYGHQQYILIIAAAAFAFVVAFHRGAVAMTGSSQQVSQSHIDAQAVLTDSLLNCETVKYYDAERVVCNRYDGALGRMETAWRHFYKHRAVNGIAIATILAAALGTSLYLAASDVARGAMTVGDFVLVNAYVLRLVQPLELLGYAVRDIAQGVAFLQALLDLLEHEREGDTPAGHAEVSCARGELTVDHVSFSYPNGRALLRDISFTVPAGHTVAIVGASGVGKSSIIRLLFRLFAPTKGRILLDGTPIDEIPLTALRQAISVVPQDTVLFHDSIANNIGFGRVGASRADIENAARIAHLHDAIMAMPEAYETIVGERGLKLSGGERQRVAIARAALKRPRIFVFDEATASLDSETEREILQNLLAVSATSTTLVIAHRLSTIVHAHKILVLEAGAVVEQGAHAELVASAGVYAAMWRAQQGSPGRERHWQMASTK